MSEISTAVTTSESWLKQHERLIIVALVLLVGGWFGQHWLNNTAAKNAAAATLATQQLAAQKAKDDQFAAQLQQQGEQYQELVVTLAQQNKQLSTQIISRTTVLKTQQATDQALPVPALASRWEQLAALKNTDVVSNADGSITVTENGARDTVIALEQVPELTANLVDTQSELRNDQTELDKANTLIGGLNTQVVNLSTQLVDQKKADDATLASVKANANKSKLKWFGAGFVVGFISRSALHF